MANLLYNLAQPFSDTKQYTQGTIVVYNDRMYEMTADEYTPGPFDPEKFTERFLSEMISGKLNSNLVSYNNLPTFKVCYDKEYSFFTVSEKEMSIGVWNKFHICFDVSKYTKCKISSWVRNTFYSAKLIGHSAMNTGNSTGTTLKDFIANEANVEIDISSYDYITFLAYYDRTYYSGGGGIFNNITFE